MPFELYPWDIRANEKKVFSQSGNGVYSFSFFDSYIENLSLKYMWKRNLFSEENVVKYGHELTIEWIQENFQTLSLFGGSQPHFIWQSDQIPKDVVEYFVSECLEDLNGERKIFFSAAKKSLLHQKLAKKQDVVSVKVAPPKFWDTKKYFDFLVQEVGVSLDAKVSNFLFEALPQTSAEIIPVLKYLRDSYGPGRKIEMEQAKPIVDSFYVDRFQVVSLLGEKRFEEYYNMLLDLGGDFSELRSHVSFSQNYILKMQDPSYLNGKASLSNYDRQLLKNSKLWNNDELFEFADLFSHWEILSKSKDSIIWEEIRCKSLSLRIS